MTEPGYLGISPIEYARRRAEAPPMHPTRRQLDQLAGILEGPPTAYPPAARCVARDCQRDAELQLLCGTCGQRLADHYGAREGHGQPGRLSHGLPWMWEHIRLAYPSVTGWSGGAGGGSDIDDPEAEKLSAVLGLRLDIQDHLTETAADLAERLGRPGPLPVLVAGAPQWAQVYRAAGWLVRNIESLRAGQGVRATIRASQVAALFASLNGEDPGTAMADVDAGTAAEAVAAILAEADDLAARAHQLAPWRAAPTRIDGIPCRCGAVGTVHDHGDTRKCWRCGRDYSPAEWSTLMQVLARRFGQTGATA